MSRCLLFALPFALVACVPDIATQTEGDYVGEIVTDDITEVDYTVTVAFVANNTISISGADFDSFDVDLMGTEGTVTSLATDTENTLSWTGGTLSVVHTGDQNVNFTGEQAE